MIINTERLELVALNAKQLKLWISDIKSLEKELNCSYEAEAMQGIFLQIVKGQYEAVEKDAENYMWHSFFWIINKKDRKVVGSADFKDLPNENGEVEIGYGLGKQFEHNGYMTEAVSAMCRWALSEKNVKSVIAETEIDNVPSHNVLKRCGFKLDKSGIMLWWRRDS